MDPQSLNQSSSVGTSDPECLCCQPVAQPLLKTEQPDQWQCSVTGRVHTFSVEEGRVRLANNQSSQTAARHRQQQQSQSKPQGGDRFPDAHETTDRRINPSQDTFGRQ